MITDARRFEAVGQVEAVGPSTRCQRHHAPRPRPGRLPRIAELDCDHPAVTAEPLAGGWRLWCHRCRARVETAVPDLAAWEAIALLAAPGGVYAKDARAGVPGGAVLYLRHAYLPRRRYRTDVASEAALEAMLT